MNAKEAGKMTAEKAIAMLGEIEIVIKSIREMIKEEAGKGRTYLRVSQDSAPGSPTTTPGWTVRNSLLDAIGCHVVLEAAKEILKMDGYEVNSNSGSLDIRWGAHNGSY
jgi:hypothetical protein